MAGGGDSETIDRPPRPKHTGLTRLLKATGYSISGVAACFRNEAAFRQEVVLAAILLPLAFFVGDSAVEIALLAGSVLLVLIVELLNSSLETITDRVGLEQNELSGLAKDMGSAAVMISLILVLVVWGLVLFYGK